jgi:hypothetical protein
MTLNETQAKIVQLIANAELRSNEQMLSLLLMEGIRFYFCDYEPKHGTAEIDPEAMEFLLKQDAIRCAMGAKSNA